MSKMAVWGAPGCGKTKFLIDRYLELSPQQNVLLTTFRRDTADSIRVKLSDLTGENVSRERVNTTHGICYRLLGGKTYADLIEPPDIHRFNTETGHKLKISYTDAHNPESSRGLIDCMSWLSNTGTPMNKIVQWPGWSSLGMTLTRATEIISELQEWAGEQGKLFYHDMEHHALKQRLVPDVDVLLIDEFQDSTHLRNEIYKMWVNEIGDTIIAGDPLQSIYGFWGGSPNYFHQFQGCIKILPISYRLRCNIWEYARQLANLYRMETPEIKTIQQPGTIKHISVKKYIHYPELWEGSLNFKVFHLIRSNYQAPAITHKLAEHGILWSGIGGWTSTELDLFNAIQAVRHGLPIGRNALKSLVNYYPCKYFNHSSSKDSLISQIDNMSVSQLPEMPGNIVRPELYTVLKSANPVAYMSLPGKLKSKKITCALNRFNRFLSWNDIGTTVTTIHGSKGLEADRVFLHTAISKNIRMSMRRDRASEARVFYVGITRTKSELYVVNDKGDNFKLPKSTTEGDIIG